nr:hypothetical protein CFP56_44274 [Quercus suber]
MSTRKEAEGVIRKIRKSRHANDPGGAEGDANARSLARALDMLSTQLYTKSTHFILELIQNADDNAYAPGVDPLLTLVYREDGYLWVGCNEVGFSKANVEAICDVNDSTKKVKNAAKGYIGEKGIGFKSVFKVADVVWVSSNNYSFRFERDKVLGMIVPIWCDFNNTKVLSERTMFCLRIPNKNDRITVKSDLLKLRSELLLFLRKLRKIEVRIYDGDTTKPSLGFRLDREESGYTQGASIVTLIRKDLNGLDKDHLEELSIARAIVRDMPIEEKRERVSETEIVLAFPTSQAAGQHVPRPVYNFLPIRTYGFSVSVEYNLVDCAELTRGQFLLQADFILTANRENIAHDNAWNDALLEGVLDLFVSAVRQFNHTGFCKYDWPNFIACDDTAHGTIMEGFISRLRKTLRDESVLESQAGYLSRPSELMLVPHHFTDGGNPAQPLFDDILNTFKYASSQYSPANLKLFGMTYQTPEQICALLRWMTPQQLEQKTLAWHSRLAVGIVESDVTAFRSAKLIPLRSGEWISASDTPFYFPNISNEVDIPTGIEVRIISKEACADPSRKRLYTLLGAEPLTEGQICNLILERHKSISPSNNTLGVSCLTSHAWYLFCNGTLGLTYGSLQVANELGQAVSGRELYMQLPNSLWRIKDYLPRDSFAAIFLHSDYMNQSAGSDQTRWFKWLSDTLHVSTLPNYSGYRSGNITPEFEYLVTNHPSIVWLTLVRDNWQYYSMDSDMHSNSAGAKKVEYRFISLVDVSDSQNSHWVNLERLGLRTKPDLDFYLTILRGVAAGHPSDVQRETMLRIYKGVETYCLEDLELAKTAFTEERLIHPGAYSSDSTWRQLGECRWEAPPSLTCVRSLCDEYSSCRVLFVEKLDLHNADAEDVLVELCTVQTRYLTPSAASWDATKSLLVALTQYDLGEARLDNHFQRLAGMDLLSVRLSPERTKLVAFSDEGWYMAIRSRHANCFAGKLWFLDLPSDQSASLADLVGRMGLASRDVSRYVEEETVTGGEIIAHTRMTDALQAKARYILVLAAHQSFQEGILNRLRNIEVFSAKSLVLRRYMTVDGQKIFGKDERGRTVVHATAHGLRLYFTAECIAGGSLPWHFVGVDLLALLDLPSENQALLNSILYTEDDAQIEDFLERANLLEQYNAEVVEMNPS